MTRLACYVIHGIVMATPIFLITCVVVTFLWNPIVGVLAFLLAHSAVKQNGGWFLGWRRGDWRRFVEGFEAISRKDTETATT